MPHTRNGGTIHGLRPGAHDLPEEKTNRDIQTEQRVRQEAADRVARRSNRAYGNLNLDVWNEATTRTKRLIPPPAGGRPRKKATPSA